MIVLIGATPSAAQASRQALVPSTAGSVRASAPLGDSVEEAEWILRSILPDGAITTHVHRQHINPYFANFAAYGLALAARDTGDARYTAAAWRWLRWYAAHQDKNGYVTDYNVSPNGKVTSTGDMDSTDAYAGTFLLAMWATYWTTRDMRKLAALRPAIVAAVSAIESTQDSDGLTWAKPSWRVKYLMDQAETFAGLRAASLMARTLGDETLAARASAGAKRVSAGVATLWNPVTGSYDWAKFEDGNRQATDWSKLYPDATQQPWAVTYGLVPPRRAAALMARFNAEQPRWDRPTALAKFDTGSAQAGYWPGVGSAFLRVGDKSRERLGYGRTRAAAVKSDRAWPFHTGVAGQLLVLNHNAAKLR